MWPYQRTWTLGELVDLDPDTVSEHALARLRFEVNSLNLALPFDCDRCGATKLGNFNDPGLLKLHAYTCADAIDDKQCRSPPMPRTTKRPAYFLPGSLVSCKIDTEEDVRWPGIVENCPDGIRSYLIQGRRPGEVKAYFVTLINSWGTNLPRWVGGFFPAEELLPFEFEGFPPNVSKTYKKALETANKASADRLPKRLAEHSFLVHVAELRGRPIKIDLHSIELPAPRRGGGEGEGAGLGQREV